MLLNVKGVSICSKPRRDGRWQGYLVTDEEKVYFYGGTYEEVAQKIQQAYDEVKRKEKKKEREKEKAAKGQTLGDFTANWIKLYKSPNLKPSSLETLSYSLKPALAALGNRALISITTDDVQKLLLDITSSRMREMCRSNLQQIFAKAVKQGLIKVNPCEAVEIKRHKYEHKNALTVAEQAAVLNEAAETNYDLLTRFLLASGCRIGEALALRASDVDVATHTVKISKNVVFIDGKKVVQDSPKTEAGRRIIPLPETMCSELVAIKGEIFPFTYNAVRLFYERLARKTGIKISAHILRHTYATRLEEAGVSPKVKQYLLGHSSLEMTQKTYTDTQADFILKLAPTLSGIFDTYLTLK